MRAGVGRPERDATDRYLPLTPPVRDAVKPLDDPPDLLGGVFSSGGEEFTRDVNSPK
jgi:hypothetical protein